MGAPCLPKFPRPVPSKDVHYRKLRVHKRTTATILHKTRNIFVTSSRGAYREALPPTKKTYPGLHRRRYSIDVTTRDWNSGDSSTKSGWFQDKEEASMPAVPAISFVSPEQAVDEYDPPTHREPCLSLPDPRRYMCMSGDLYHPIHSQDIYLELHQATLTNEDFNYIDTLQGVNSWFTDNTLNTALECIMDQFDCKAHNIVIANSMTSQILFHAAYFEELGGLDEYVKQFENANFIFLPVNDGFDGNDTSESGGSHWSFIAVNRLQGTAHYIDSMFLDSKTHRWVAFMVTRGLASVLKEYLQIRFERNSPHQLAHNLCQVDSGACGPFTYEMIKYLVFRIRCHQHHNAGDVVDFTLQENFQEWFGDRFDSAVTRKDIMERVVAYKREMEARKLIEEHDCRAMADGLDDFDYLELPEEVMLLYDSAIFMASTVPASETSSNEKVAESETTQSENWEAIGWEDEGGIKDDNASVSAKSDTSNETVDIVLDCTESDAETHEENENDDTASISGDNTTNTNGNETVGLEVADGINPQQSSEKDTATTSAEHLHAALKRLGEKKRRKKRKSLSKR